MKKILYIVSVFPATSATFILNEMLMLKEKGYKIKIVSLRKPINQIYQNGVEEFEEDIIYVPHIKQSLNEGLKLISSNFKYLIYNPIKYIKGLYKASKGKSTNLIYDYIRAVYLVNYLNNSEIDHIHSQFAHGPTTIAYYLNMLTGKKFSFTCHAVDIFVQSNSKTLEEKINKAEFVATISNYNVGFIENKLINKNLVGKLNVVRCGINPQDYKPLEKPKYNEVKKIFSVGRFVEKKGFKYLIDALKIISDKGINFQCNIVGDGPLFNEINEKVQQLKLTKKINLIGQADSQKIKDYLSNSDMFVLPCTKATNGDMDGIPVSLMESMAYKLPVVSTNISGIPELVIDGKNGLIVEEKNSEKLADAIEKLILNKDIRLKYGENGRKHIIDEFGLEVNIAKLSNLFNPVS